jgi:hypothetical protein
MEAAKAQNWAVEPQERNIIGRNPNDVLYYPVTYSLKIWGLRYFDISDEN